MFHHFLEEFFPEDSVRVRWFMAREQFVDVAAAGCTYGHHELCRSVNEWMGPEAGDLRQVLPLLERIGSQI